MKKSQVTVFIIMGLVLTLAIFLTFTLVSKIYDTGTDNDLDDIYDFNEKITLKSYVENCIDLVSYDKVINIGKNGGTFDMNNNEFISHSYIKDNNRINTFNRKLCSQAGYIGCLNSMLTLEEISYELKTSIMENLTQCINLSVFEEQGYDVLKETMELYIDIGPDEIFITLNYPISLKKSNDIQREDQFSTSLAIPLGRFALLANDIINTEILEGKFDQDKFIYKHLNEFGKKIIIEKHKPYPNIVYSIINPYEEFEFNFAIQGEDTVSQIGFTTAASQYRQNLGCCHIARESGSYCFANAESSMCEDFGGSYLGKPCSCEVIESDNSVFDDKTCPSGECTECSATWNTDDLDYTGPSRQHGESWCVYDSITNRGMDYVGARHYKHLCIDGVEYYEECRDYREELCTQYKTTNMTHAVCRVNRWFDCTDCEDKNCCQEDTIRDCFWSGDEFPDMEKKCHPLVSPGFKFWSGNGADVCAEGFSEKEFMFFSESPTNWVNENALLCTKLGDCGNYRNILDERSTNGFYSSDVRISPDPEYMYNSNGLNRNFRNLSKRIEIDLESVQTKEFDKPTNLIPRIYAAVSSSIAEVSSLNPSDFLCPFCERPDFTFTNIAYCSVYNPPKNYDDCSRCAEDPFKPCTLYRCKSLGKGCIFEEDNNTCSAESRDNIAPSFYLDNSTMVDYQIVQDNLVLHLNNYEGYSIIPDVKPYTLLKLKLISDEPTQCKFDFMPALMADLPNDYLPALWFGDMEYNTSHTIKIRVPPRVSVPGKLMDLLNLTSISDLYTWFKVPELIANDLERRFGRHFSLYQQITGRDLRSQIESSLVKVAEWKTIYEDIMPFIDDTINTILQQINNNGYYMFVMCQDKAGNSNLDEKFIRFNIAQGADNEPPIILRTKPDNMTFIYGEQIDLEVYVSEPSECSYSFSNVPYNLMEYPLDCTIRDYDISPVEYGSYECNGVVNVTGQNKIFIRCRDQPDIIEELKINFFETNAFDIIGGPESFFYNLTPPNEFGVVGNILDEYDVQFLVNETIVDLTLYFNDKQECRITNDPNEDFEQITQKFSRCEISDDISKGIYQCDKTINVKQGEKPDDLFFTDNYSMKFIYDTVNYVSDPASRDLIEFDGSQITILRTDTLRGDGTDINVNNSYITLRLRMYGNAECRFGETRVEIDMLPEHMGCVYANGYTTCTRDITIPHDYWQIYASCKTNLDSDFGNSTVYYVQCRDENATAIADRNVNAASYRLDLFNGTGMDYSVSPFGQVSNDRINFTVNLNVNITKEDVSCRYNTDYTSFGFNILNDTSFIKVIDLEPGNNTFHVSCSNRYEEIVMRNVTIIS